MKPFPPTVTQAIIQTSEWLRTQEDWVLRGQVADIGDRLQSATSVAHEMGLGTRRGGMDRKTRREILYILSYLPADIRIGYLISMSDRNPAALEDLLGSEHDARFEPALYNVVQTIGALARHGLLSDIFTRERMDRVERILKTSSRGGTVS